jgi:hypothetical protein
MLLWKELAGYEMLQNSPIWTHSSARFNQEYLGIDETIILQEVLGRKNR